MTMELKIERRNLFYAIIIVLPNWLLYCLSSFVFVLPVESGEKMSFSITILLAEIVSFASIADILPASSLNFPKVGCFVCVAVIQTSLSSLLAMLGKFVNSGNLVSEKRVISIISVIIQYRKKLKQ